MNLSLTRPLPTPLRRADVHISRFFPNDNPSFRLLIFKWNEWKKLVNDFLFCWSYTQLVLLYPLVHQFVNTQKDQFCVNRFWCFLIEWVIKGDYGLEKTKLCQILFVVPYVIFCSPFCNIHREHTLSSRPLLPLHLLVPTSYLILFIE